MGWFALQYDETEKRAALSIMGEIGWEVTAAEFAAQLAAIPKDAAEIRVQINSPGGAVVDGITVFNALLEHPAKVVARVDFAASMASVIAMAADEIHIAENGFMFVHNPWTIAAGDAEQLRADAEALDKIKATIVSAYRRHTEMSADDVSAVMDGNTLYNAAEAVAAGFATSMSPRIEKVAACLPGDAELAGIIAEAAGDDRESLAPFLADPQDFAGDPLPAIDAAQIAAIRAEIAQEFAGQLSALQAKVDSAAGRVEELETDLRAATAARDEQAKAVANMQARFDKLTAGFIPQTEKPKNTAMREYLDKLEELRAAGDQNAVATVAEKWPELAEAAIKEANAKTRRN